jgi:hypothetical protein
LRPAAIAWFARHADRPTSAANVVRSARESARRSVQSPRRYSTLMGGRSLVKLRMAE